VHGKAENQVRADGCEIDLHAAGWPGRLDPHRPVEEPGEEAPLDRRRRVVPRPRDPPGRVEVDDERNLRRRHLLAQDRLAAGLEVSLVARDERAQARVWHA
jgi:hypothetical protein